MKGFCKSIASNIVERWAKPAGDENNSRAFSRCAELIDDRLHVVGQRCVSRDCPAQRFQFTTKPLAICVELGTAGELRSDGNDFSVHLI